MAVGTTVSMPSSQEKDWEQWLKLMVPVLCRRRRSPSANDATNKTFRYDPFAEWTRMADMNHARASFELNFHGQLYAMGGFMEHRHGTGRR